MATQSNRDNGHDRNKQKAANDGQEPRRGPATTQRHPDRLTKDQGRGPVAKADTLSLSEVADKVHNLNIDIYRAAVLLGEILLPHVYPEEERLSALASVSEMLGLNIISALISASRKMAPQINPNLPQVALRVFFINFCARLVNEWCPDDLAKSRALEAMYEDIRNADGQAVSGPWRAVARSRIELDLYLWQTQLLTSLNKLLVFSGWKMAPDTDRTNLEGSIRLVLKAAEVLRRALGECVISMDLYVYYVSAGHQSRREFLQDVYADPGAQPVDASRSNVIGTTGFGLKEATGGKHSNGQLEFAPVVACQVILEAAFREALADSPPPTPSSHDAAGTTVPKTNRRPAIPIISGVEQSAKYKISEPRPGV